MYRDCCRSSKAQESWRGLTDLIVAKVAASQIRDRNQKAQACCEIAETQAEVGDVVGARATAAQIIVLYENLVLNQAMADYMAKGCAASVAAQATAGDPAGAIEFITGITGDKEKRCEWLARAAVFCVRARILERVD